MKRILFAVLALIVTSLAQAAAIEKLHRFLDTTHTMRADFAQIVVANNGGKAQKSSGVMYLSRPGKFRWQIDKPYEQLLVGDGEKVWIYDPDLRQVTVKIMNAALGSTPAALLVGAEGDKSALDENFSLRESGEREGLEWLEATPKSTDSGFEKLAIGFAGSELKSMELHDNFGQTTTLVFSKAEINAALAPSLFRFVPPAGADVIGE